jgi:signal transduction histidine kinase
MLVIPFVVSSMAIWGGSYVMDKAGYGYTTNVRLTRSRESVIARARRLLEFSGASASHAGMNELKSELDENAMVLWGAESGAAANGFANMPADADGASEADAGSAAGSAAGGSNNIAALMAGVGNFDKVFTDGARGQVAPDTAMFAAIGALGGSGVVTNGDYELFAQKLAAGGREYVIYVLNRRNAVFFDNPGVFFTLTSILIYSAFFLLIFATNRFLISFVFKRIRQPLKVLSDGVHQIRDGNLEHRIVYGEPDEFFQICDDFNEMARRLKSSVDEVQKNEHNRKELIANISHDLRSPLTSIKAYVEGLLDGVANTPESRLSYLRIIKSKTEDINSMVSKLFLFSKLDMGNYPSYPEKLDIGREISDFVAASREDYAARGLRIEIAALPAGTCIFADPTQLRSVFANILDNSAKYSDHASALAVISCLLPDSMRGMCSMGGMNGFSGMGGAIGMHNSFGMGRHVRIVFEDNGPGVPEDALPKLFEVFYRLDPSRSNPQKGSGLGLAIVKKALDGMNSRIYAENRKDGSSGLRVIVAIPVIEDGGAAATVPAEAETEADKKTGAEAEADKKMGAEADKKIHAAAKNQAEAV